MILINNEQAKVLRDTREYFYRIEWAYGEMFDTNFVDSMITFAVSFEECLHIAIQDVENFINIKEEIHQYKDI